MRLSLYWILVFLTGSCRLLELESTTRISLIVFPMGELPCFKMAYRFQCSIGFTYILKLRQIASTFYKP